MIARRLACNIVLCGVLIACWACGRREAAPPLDVRGQAIEEPPAALEPRLAALTELSFVPVDAAAVVRVNLADVAARSADPEQSLKTLDFILRAQQPAAWQALHAADVTVGKEVHTLYLVAVGAGPAAAYLVAGLGEFDDARLAQGLKVSGAAVEAGPGACTIFTWRRPREGAVGASMPPDDAALGEAALGLGRGFLLFGPPDLVRRALAARAGATRDVRSGALAAELVEIDAAATVWGAAHALPGVVPGLQRGHFQAMLAAPGHDLDGMLLVRASFATADQAKHAGEALRSAVRTAAAIGGRSPLGATLEALQKSAKIDVQGTTLVAMATL